MRILNVVNKRLPEGDYRLVFSKTSEFAQVTYGLPGQPESVRDADYVFMNFREGLGFKDVIAFVSLFLHLRKNRKRYDLVHFFSTKLQLFGPLCARLAGVRSITTITGFGRTFNRESLACRGLRRPYLWLLKSSARTSVVTLFQNIGDMQWLAKRLPDIAPKLAWVGSGVDCEVVRKKCFAEGPLKVLFVARLMQDKGVQTFLHAAESLSKKNVEFTVVGPRSQGEDALYQDVLHAEQQGLITYRGELNTAALALAYQQHHVFVLPTRGEGMPRVLLEAGHALLCPVASKVHATQDLIAEGQGFFLDEADENSSIVSLLEMLNDDRTRLAKNAQAYQAHVVEKYSLAAYTRQMDRKLLEIRDSVSLETDPNRIDFCNEQDESATPKVLCQWKTPRRVA